MTKKNDERDDELPKAWLQDTAKPSYADLSDPRLRDEVLTFERPRGLMRRGKDLEYLAGKTRFAMMMTIAVVMLVVGITLAVSGFTGTSWFVVPITLGILSLAVVVDLVLFARLWIKERAFTRELDAHIVANDERLNQDGHDDDLDAGHVR